MDEPLGALDKQLREQMQLEIRDLHRRLGLTIVFVTHDQGEALTMSDRIAIFDKGRIAQIGTASDVYDRPANRFVAAVHRRDQSARGHGRRRRAGDDPSSISAAGRRVEAARPGRLGRRGGAVVVSVRPERIRVGPPARAGPNALSATVEDCVYQGDHLRLHLDAAPWRLVARLGAPCGRAGRSARDVTSSFAPADCSVFAA